MANEKEEYNARCHCGRMKGKFYCNKYNLVAWECNCSDCSMRGNIHCIIPEDDFCLEMEETLDSATILYEWGTKTAKRNFCKTCGILPWYRPKSNPDGYGVTLKCIDWGDKTKPKVEIKQFDGQNWLSCFASSNISELSKK